VNIVAVHINVVDTLRFWTAPAERSGDGAFARMKIELRADAFPPGESGVALRLPPQSKTR
jgi:hypothetical protein